jgi:hypothetical protein
MIRYSLKCGSGHGFESWFQSAEAFAALAASGHLACPACGTDRVEKELMAPTVRPAKRAAVGTPSTPASAPPQTRPDLTTPSSPLEEAIAAFRRQIAENSDYVGMNFAAEARRIHAGEAPERAIHGEARPDEAKAMIEDGLPVAPLPFLPARKVN